MTRRLARACFEGTANGGELCRPGAGTELGRRERAEEWGEDRGTCLLSRSPIRPWPKPPEPERGVRERSGQEERGGAAPTGREPPLDLRAQGSGLPHRRSPELQPCGRGWGVPEAVNAATCSWSRTAQPGWLAALTHRGDCRQARAGVGVWREQVLAGQIGSAHSPPSGGGGGGGG